VKNTAKRIDLLKVILFRCGAKEVLEDVEKVF
jgi:hypothetical protein